MTSITITNAGNNLFRDSLSGANSDLIKYVALGTSSTPPAATDTQLGSEVFRKPVSSFTNGASVGEVLVNAYIASNEAVGQSIAEIGFFGGSSATSTTNTGVLIAHGLYSLVSKTNLQSLQIQFDLIFSQTA